MKTMRMKNRIWGWLCVLCIMPLCIQAQTGKALTLQLKDKPLPAALKLIEKEGGKSIIFSYNETEGYRVNADIRQKTEAEAIGIALQGTPFIYRERAEYFVIRRKDAVRTVEIRGKVTDENRQPLAYSNVLLMTPDSTFVNGCVTRPDGSFVMLGESGVSYLLKVSFMGYKTAFSVCGDDNLISLSPDTQTLEEVTVTAERPLIEPNANGLKANVLGTSLAKMGTASEMLGHLPFVTGKDGDFSVLGHGKPEIYINNRKVRDTSELDRLRADEILSAEVITTPGAEYASDVTAVIRIRTVKQRGQGWSGSLAANYTQGNLGNGYGQVKLNYRTGGLDIFGSGYVTRSTLYGNSMADDRLEASSLWERHTQTHRNRKQDYFFGTLGFNYDFNERHSVGVRYDANTPFGHHKNHVYADVSVMRDGVLYEEIKTEQINENKEKWNHSVNGYYTGSIGKWQLDVNADYYFGQSETAQQVFNNGESDVESTSKVRNYLYAVKAVASTPLPLGHLSVGTEETFTNRHDLFLQSGFSADADNHVKQSIWSAFANYFVPLGKWNLSAGFRYEHQKTDYYEEGIYRDVQSPRYNDFIPTLSAYYADKNWTLTLAYKYNKYNPPYGILSNAINYRSKYEYFTGNPLLRPQKNQTVSLNASWKWIYMNLWYADIKDSYITVSQAYNDETHPGVTLIDYQCIPKSAQFGGNVILAPKFGIWQPQATFSISVWDSDMEAIGITHNWKDPYCYFILDNTFTLPKGWLINIQGTYVPKFKQQNAKKKAIGVVDFRLTKSFLKDNALSVTLTANDIFHQQHNAMTSYSIGTSTTFTEYYDHQRVGVTLSYKFNATKSKYKGTGAGQSEKSRL